MLNLRDGDAVREAFDQIRAAVAEKAGIEHFEGVTIQPMINWTGYELIVGLVARPAVRPGAAVRDGRPAGRGVPRPGARAAAAQHDAGAAPDPRDDDLGRARGRPRPPADRRGRARGAARALQRARRGAAADRRDRHQPAAGVTGADHRPRRAGGAAPGLGRRRRPAAARDPARTRTSTSARSRPTTGSRSSSGRSAPRTSPRSPASTPRCPRRRSGRATAWTGRSPSGPRTSG